ncbi:scm-like with four MBT domains protein 2 isoform X2 [Brevipalpus obovatus]|uniref:scm-like with four MBT domains protein 2 isoform X2 n=1 Tax=Brevipalpus obovatus TaxID=246614 RepID=UPI003D9F89A0
MASEESEIKTPTTEDQESECISKTSATMSSQVAANDVGNGDGNVDNEDMDEEIDEDLVPEDAFWHIEASRINGFETDMKIEIEHETGKYWFATITNVCSNLLSIRWTGATNDSWFDVKHNQCYPYGHLRDSDKETVPPSSLKLSDEQINETIEEYKKFNDQQQQQQQNDSANQNKPFGLFRLGGLDPVQILAPGTILEVDFPNSSNRLWFAAVKQNIGGRLLLEWHHNGNVTETCSYGPMDFWLHFCHPRVHHLCYGRDRQDVVYFPPFKLDSYSNWMNDLNEFFDLRDNSEKYDLVQYLISNAKQRRPDLIDPLSIENLRKRDIALTFPSDRLELVLVSVSDKEHDSFTVQTQEPPLRTNCIPIDDNIAVLPINWAEEYGMSLYNFQDASKDFHSYLKKNKARAAPIKLVESERVFKFKVNHKLEIIHPQDSGKICEGIVTRVTPPLVWIEISNDLVHVLPYNSTDLYPIGFCEDNDYHVTKLLTPTSKETKGKKIIADPEPDENDSKPNSRIPNSLLPEVAKGMCPRIYFNHKCFTGPLLSKSKIRELPRFVGPGPVLLVLQEVISKIISVAYVPPRVLNELSSKGFEELLKKVSVHDTHEILFKAKYQKKSFHDGIYVAQKVEEIEEFCKAVCGHLKCCYNLFGPQLYDGDDCPSHCRGLRKTNKVLKRAIYYRQKAAKTKPNSQPTKDSAASTPSNSQTIDGQDDDKKSEDSVTQSKKKKKKTPEPEKEDSSGNDDEGSRDNCENGISRNEKNDKDSKDVMQAINDSKNEYPLEESVTKPKQNSAKPIERSTREIKGRNLVKQSAKKRKFPDDDYGYQNMRNNRGALNDRDQELKKSSHTFPKKVAHISNTFYDNPLTWSAKDVYNFIEASPCSSLASILLAQEIDGAALMLLDSRTIETTFGFGYTDKFDAKNIKRLCHLINHLKKSFFEHHNSLI